MRSWFWTYGIFGAILSSLALASLCVRIFHVGLVPVATDIVASYRAVTHPIMSWLLVWMHWIRPDWILPDWLRDVYTLSFIGAFGYVRGDFLGNDMTAALRNDPDVPGPIDRTIGVILFGIIGGGLFLGLFAYPWAIFRFFVKPKWAELQPQVHRIIQTTIVASTFGGLAGTIAFLALNYGALHDWKW